MVWSQSLQTSNFDLKEKSTVKGTKEALFFCGGCGTAGYQVILCLWPELKVTMGNLGFPSKYMAMIEKTWVSQNLTVEEDSKNVIKCVQRRGKYYGG